MKPAKRFVELELASGTGVDPISVSALGLADVIEGEQISAKRKGRLVA